MQILSALIIMSTLPEKDGMIQELVRLKIANKLMDEEMKRLQPELAKYESSSMHPAARPVPAESVSTSSLTEKTKGIKQDTIKMKMMENDLTSLNKRVTSLFNDVEAKVSQRDALFSEIEQATSMMNTLTIESPRFEDDCDVVRNTVHSDSKQLISVTNSFQDRIKVKLSHLAALQKTQSDLDNTIDFKHGRIMLLRAQKEEYASKINHDSLAQLKKELENLVEKTVNLKEYIATVTKDEGQRLENLTLSITECDMLKKKKAELSNHLEEVNADEERVIAEMEEKQKVVEDSQKRLSELMARKEEIAKNHETAMTELKERIDPLIESLKTKQIAAESERVHVAKRIENREECMRLRAELDAEGKVEPLDLSKEIESLKQEISDTRAITIKTRNEAENYRSAAVKCNTQADDMHAADSIRRKDQERALYEKDGVANHYENEVFKLKTKLRQEKVERENRLAQETQRLLEKAKEDKGRKEKEEKRRLEKEKEKKKKIKEEEDKKKKMKEEQEKKKKEEAKNRMIDAVQNKDGASLIRSRVQQRRMNLEAAASIPYAYNDGALMRPPVNHTPVPTLNIRPQSIQKKPICIFEDDSSDEDDDDMSDFLMDDSDRVMPKVPEKYAGSHARVDKQMTPLNPFELSFTDVQSSTPMKMLKSKTNKKQTRPRGNKKKSK